jgi:hypothetical protein
LLFKNRIESPLLLKYRILNSRSDLTVEEQKYYLKLEKGFQGEVQFDLMTEKLQSECYVINDLLLEVNNTEFQIDTLIIFQENIYLIDVKNNEGDHIYYKDEIQTLKGKKIKNPLLQLKRTTSLFRQLLQEIGCTYPVEAYDVFINQEFTLYQAHSDLPFIFPTQINSFMKKLDMKSSRLTVAHKKLADKLISMHLQDSSNTRFPTYHDQQIKKGITCKQCYSLSTSTFGKNVVCQGCGFEEKIPEAVIRSVRELQILFPERKITTKGIFEWCKIVKSRKRIKRILGSHFKTSGVRQWTYFVTE